MGDAAMLMSEMVAEMVTALGAAGFSVGSRDAQELGSAAVSVRLTLSTEQRMGQGNVFDGRVNLHASAALEGHADPASVQALVRDRLADVAQALVPVLPSMKIMAQDCPPPASGRATANMVLGYVRVGG